MERIRRRLTYANVMSTIGVFLALGGVSYAALHLPKNSVGNKQIRKSAVSASKIKKNAVSASKVKNGSLKAVDFGAGQLPQGEQGPPGTPGTNGTNGSDGTAVAFARIDSAGNLVGGPDQSKGVAQANIVHSNTAPDATQTTATGVGVYCFGGLGFTPKSAHVALDNTDSMPALPGLTGGTINMIPSVAINKGEELGRCPAGFEQARVAIEQVNDSAVPTLANHGFFIWFE